MNTNLLKAIFYIAAVYDGFFGIMGIFAPGFGFDLFEVEPPNHVGYVQFSAILLLIFGLMFFQIARNPIRNRHLIPYGMALKAGYSGLIFYYMLTTGIPSMWVPWAWIDLGFLALFIYCWYATSNGQQDSQRA